MRVVFAPVYEQPALPLPFGGFDSAQLIEYFINLKLCGRPGRDW